MTDDKISIEELCKPLSAKVKPKQAGLFTTDPRVNEALSVSAKWARSMQRRKKKAEHGQKT